MSLKVSGDSDPSDSDPGNESSSSSTCIMPVPGCVEEEPSDFAAMLAARRNMERYGKLAAPDLRQIVKR